MCIRMLRKGFECFESRSNASNPFHEWLEFDFECFESLSIGLNLDSNASNPFLMVRIWIRMLQILFEWFEVGFEWLEFGFERFESLSNGSNLHSNR